MPRRAPMLLLLLCLMGARCAIGADARIEMELVTESNLDPAAPQRWFQLLTELGVADLRIRSAEAQDRLTVETRGTPAAPIYRVTAVLTFGNEIVVPGHRFRFSDRAGIAAWLDRLRTAGPTVASTTTKLPFDLAPDMLQQAQQALRRPLSIATADRDTMDVLRTIHTALDGRLRMSAASREVLRGMGPVRDELQGLSVGTALASVLRPAGLAFAPQRSPQGELQYTVFAPASSSEVWPIGWGAEEHRRRLAPKLFEFLTVEISGVPVSQAVDVIRQRLELPMLFDHVAMAAHGIDPQQVPAELPGKRTSYSLALQRVLRQAGLKVELRVDDGERPFFWVSTVKRYE